MAMAIKIEEYVTSELKNHFAEWFNGLSIEYAAKVAAARARMMAGNMGNVKSIDGTLKPDLFINSRDDRAGFCFVGSFCESVV